MKKFVLILFFALLTTAFTFASTCPRSQVLKVAYSQMNLSISLQDLLDADKKGLVDVDYLGDDPCSGHESYSVTFGGGIFIVVMDDII